MRYSYIITVILVLYSTVRRSFVYELGSEVTDEAIEICSCGLKVIVNESDSFVLKSPKYAHVPCTWDFHLNPNISFVINCFTYGIPYKGLDCSEEKTSFSIFTDDETETYCRPFHHFSKHIQGSTNGQIIRINFKRHQKLEAEGESFTCSINGYYEKTIFQNTIDSSNDHVDGIDFNHKSCGKVNFPLRRMRSEEIISPEEYPWMVPLSIEGGKLCGGIIIGHIWILTSAHCLTNANWVKIYFGVREYGFSETTQISQEFIIHPNYDFPHHDIALIKLSKRLIFNRFIRPVCLPLRDPIQDIYIGFGWSELLEDGMSRYLKGTFLQEVNLESCKSSYGYSALRSNIICTNSSITCGNNSDQESDFSASSLGQMEKDKFVLHGIGSFLSNKCSTKFPMGFTRVLPHINWMKEYLINSTVSAQLFPLFDILDHGF